jgi:Type VI secretion system (T6SS), amidase effector protein 4
VPIFQFQTLWKNHPTIKGDAPLLDRKTYANQCAINLSASLIRAGVPLKDFHGALSWDKGPIKYALRAQELADWLAFKSRFLGKSCIKIGADDFNKSIANQNGIIFFKNYWGAGNQGDHIDLWNGSRLTDWRSWARINIRFGSYGLHNLGAGSDFKKAEAVWFWGIS